MIIAIFFLVSQVTGLEDAATAGVVTTRAAAQAFFVDGLGLHYVANRPGGIGNETGKASMSAMWIPLPAPCAAWARGRGRDRACRASSTR